ncbi:hypothetical protein LCH33_002122 [Pseudomonas amygdali]|uniref:Uncharacterized protein n=1 Tax=Pseudomonas amygdali pv. hibisci TaxID=251723 RepID=A0AB34UBK7_PSEA0|nr:hypothetical protein [Pseudomonas amygdali]KPX57068.1 Uncharacterized protein ALO67_02258 [Pseudomonas amygdali pv. hibisci]RMN61831.1 hypothetical protein ALQ57_02650 [Pseudomonas amygdali pv. hibisci]UBT78759.1 hypothetical protein LCH33_002122 [Pseudomonas amygdali]
MTTNPNDVRVSRETVSFEFRHPANGEAHTVSVSLEEIAHHMCEVLFEKLCGEFCQCEPVGETNVVDCRCDEYADEFERVKSYAQPADQQGDPVGQWSDDDGISWCDGNESSLASARASGWLTRTLYRHAQPATAKLDEQAEFDNWVMDNSMQGVSMFDVWQARAKLNTLQ